jgi:hypothetical protein
LPTFGPSPSTPSSGRRPGSEAGRRRRFRFRTGAPYLVPFLAATAAAAAAWFWRADLLDAGSVATLQSPETQVRQALAAQGRAHLEDIYGWKAGGTLELVPVRYADVVPDVEGSRATVVAVLDAEGKAIWRDQAATVSYIGREQFHMKPCKIALWCAEGDQFARLRAVLRTLFRRLDAARAGEPAAVAALAADNYQDGAIDRAALKDRLRLELSSPRPDIRVKGWQIRVERDGAEVGEDFEVADPRGGVRDRRARYRLERRGERWLFTSGL